MGLKLHWGLGLPNLQQYYHAAQFSQLTAFHAEQEISLWVRLETADCDPITLDNYKMKKKCTKIATSKMFWGQKQG